MSKSLTTECSTHLLILLFLGSTWLLSQFAGSEGSTFYVTPSVQDTCSDHDDPCITRTLSNYTASPDHYFVSGMTFVFLPGEHHLTAGSFIVIRDIANVSLVGSRNATVQVSQGYLTNLKPAAVITCGSSGGFAFINVSQLHIQGLGFNRCGSVIPPDLAMEALTVQTTSTLVIPKNTLKSSLLLVNIRSLDMDTVLVENSYGYGLLGLNVIGEVQVRKCNFSLNNYYTYNEPMCTSPTDTTDIYECVGGNARLLYSDPAECPSSAETYTVRIHQSNFFGGVDLCGSLLPLSLVNRGTGLGVSFAQRTYGVRLMLTNVHTHGNTGGDGANLYLQSHAVVEKSSVKIQNCRFSHGNAFYPLNRNSTSGPLYNLSESGVGLALYHGIENVDVSKRAPVCGASWNEGNSTEEILSIYNSSFVDNVGTHGGIGVGILLIVFPHINSEFRRVITIDRVNVTNNIGLNGVGLMLLEILPSQKLDVSIANSVFAYNTASEVNTTESVLLLGGNTTVLRINQPGTLAFISGKNISITNCSLHENRLSAISASNSQLIFRGDVLFSRNIGSNGGAVSLQGDSVLFLKPHLQMDFTDNFAVQRGGAVYVSGDYLFDPLCFFQVSDPSLLPTSQLDINLTFENNTALEAGDALYGGTLDRCFAGTLSGFLFHDALTFGSEIFDKLTDIRQDNSNSVISSGPRGLCFCIGDEPNCDLQTQERFLFPGQSIQVSIVAIGQRQGTVPAVIRSFFLFVGTSLFGPLQELQELQGHCENLTYTILSNQTEDIMTLVPDNTLLTYPLRFLLLYFSRCPVGFELTEELGLCLCSRPLRDRNITCDIKNETISRVAPYWFSAVSGELAFHDHCPFDYCRDETVEMDLAEPDTQCAFDRTGVLCGGCTDGLSLSLGTSKCKECSNLYLLLIIPFAIMGILLVVILSGLNLTVKVGTIHGLIFYANVVKINQAVFFPSGEVNFFNVFLSWLNLDFGIESCFFDGLDTYSKTWLQFAFPLYIWGIGIIIIACAHYSTRWTQIFSNAVHVLDTLFLLSYTKILRAITTALSFTIVEYEGVKGDEKVWLSDGNLSYGEGKHIGLIVFTCLFSLLILLYTIFLLFAQPLNRYAHKWAFKWIADLLPHLDAYIEPYKIAHGYWTGLLLLVRITYVLVSAFNVLGDPAVNVMVVNLTSFLLAAYILGTGGVYKNRFLTVLEASVFINLGVLSAATCYVSNTGGDQQVLVYTSVAIVFAEFLGILYYHLINCQMKSVPKVFQYLCGCWLSSFDVTVDEDRSIEMRDVEAREVQACKTTYVDIRADETEQ